MRYEINGDVTTIYDNKGRDFLIDTDQLEKVIKYNWYVDNRKGYVLATTKKINNIQLHRYLLGINSFVDHINRNPRDNRLSNLRPCTIAENNQNRGVRKDNACGVKGVSVVPNRKAKYRVRVQAYGKRVTIGCFENLEDARAAYEKASAQLFSISPRISQK